MTTNPLKPGDTVYVLDPYMNLVTECMVARVDVLGAFLTKDKMSPVSFSLLFDTKEDAARGIVARAESEVKAKQRDLENAERALARLRKMYSEVVSVTA